MTSLHRARPCPCACQPDDVSRVAARSAKRSVSRRRDAHETSRIPRPAGRGVGDEPGLGTASSQAPSNAEFIVASGVAAGRGVVVNSSSCRGVAQPGRALGSGPRGRRFESSRPDHRNCKGRNSRKRVPAFLVVRGSGSPVPSDDTPPSARPAPVDTVPALEHSLRARTAHAPVLRASTTSSHRARPCPCACQPDDASRVVTRSGLRGVSRRRDAHETSRVPRPAGRGTGDEPGGRCR